MPAKDLYHKAVRNALVRDGWKITDDPFYIDHYQIIRTGWRDEEHRVYGCLMHIDIKNGKIWIQRDGTEVGTANELVEMGVPKEDIVLAFYPPYKRPYTGFGVN
jgi:hypothetical protein